ncbi:recombinase family protein [Clostridium novyi]|uniref:DNA recombinase, putative n=1 Tax=Clostridium novyi (strain NT) TaxID=386415 RepID=A0Q0X4_CLONN|nr:recombinase family protein [Clostridium novyi]ABK61503.1 DNA recombinase, putative [Clostridium novyi NT]
MIAVYCRVSTEDQQERKTIENQISFAEKYCDLHELKLFKIYKEDGVSGTIPLEDRPQGKQLIKDAKNNKFDTLLLYKLDRLGRSARITLNSIHLLEELNVQIKSMTEPFDTSSPSGRFMITMLAGVADLERSTILERMWLGANRAAKEGKWLGGIVPYGYFVNEDKYLEVNNNIISEINLSEADVVKLIFSLATENNMSCIKIADYLNSLNIPPSYKKDNRKILKGKRKVSVSGIWSPSSILRMLHNTTYKGVHEYGKRSQKKREIITREVPAIITEDIWNKAQGVIKDNIIEATRNRKRNYLLKGLIKCGKCGCNYVGAKYKHSNYYYVCGGKIKYNGPFGKCTSKNLNGEYIENMIWNDITEFINNPGETINILKENLKTKDSNKQDLINQKELLETNLRAKETEKQSILDLFRKGIITANDVEIQLSKIQKEFNAIQDNLNAINHKLNEMYDIPDYTKVDEMLKSMKLIINQDNISFEDKRQIVKTLLDKITVNTIEENNTKSASLDIKYSFIKVENHTFKDSYWKQA